MATETSNTMSIERILGEGVKLGFGGKNYEYRPRGTDIAMPFVVDWLLNDYMNLPNSLPASKIEMLREEALEYLTTGIGISVNEWAAWVEGVVRGMEVAPKLSAPESV